MSTIKSNLPIYRALTEKQAMAEVELFVADYSRSHAFDSDMAEDMRQLGRLSAVRAIQRLQEDKRELYAPFIIRSAKNAMIDLIARESLRKRVFCSYDQGYGPSTPAPDKNRHFMIDPMEEVENTVSNLMDIEAVSDDFFGGDDDLRRISLEVAKGSTFADACRLFKLSESKMKTRMHKRRRLLMREALS